MKKRSKLKVVMRNPGAEPGSVEAAQFAVDVRKDRTPTAEISRFTRICWGAGRRGQGARRWRRQGRGLDTARTEKDSRARRCAPTSEENFTLAKRWALNGHAELRVGKQVVIGAGPRQPQGKDRVARCGQGDVLRHPRAIARW